jgi:hypothetical protein
MSYWYLKCGEDVDVTYRITLEDESYDLRLKWINRDESWQAYLGATGQDPSVSFKVTNGFNLLKPYYHLEGVPPGELYAIDVVNLWGRPDFDHMGIDKRFRLLYIDSTTEDYIGG